MVERLQKRCFKRATSSQTTRQDLKWPSKRRTSPSLKTLRSMASVAKGEDPAWPGWARDGSGASISAQELARRAYRQYIAIQYQFASPRPGLHVTVWCGACGTSSAVISLAAK
jgi:hypothetical protein